MATSKPTTYHFKTHYAAAADYRVMLRVRSTVPKLHSARHTMSFKMNTSNVTMALVRVKLELTI